MLKVEVQQARSVKLANGMDTINMDIQKIESEIILHVILRVWTRYIKKYPLKTRASLLEIKTPWIMID